MGETTTIQVDVATWQRLSGLKRPGDSFDDVVNRAVDALQDVTADHPESADPDDPVDALTVPGEGAKADHRRASVRAALAYLQDEGSAKRADFQRDVFPQNDGKYSTPDSWWKNLMQDALGDLAETVDELEPATTRDPWRWRD